MRYLSILVMFMIACGPKSAPAVKLTGDSQTQSGNDASTNNTNVPGGVVIQLPAGSDSQTPKNPSTPPPTQPTQTPTPTPNPTPATSIGEVDAKLPSGLVWVGGNGTSVPQNAVYTSDATNNPVRSYICRGQVSGAYVPGALKVNGKCYVNNGGVAQAHTSFQILTYTGNPNDKALALLNGENGKVPAKALGVGLKNGRLQYLCFLNHSSDFFVGGKDEQTNGCVYADFTANKDAPTAVTASSQYYDVVAQ